MQILFTMLLAAAPLQDPDSAKAEKLYQAMAAQLVSAKTLQCSFEIAMQTGGGAAKASGTIAFAEGNRHRLKAEGDFFGNKLQVETVSDGMNVKMTMGAPGAPAQSSTGATPAKANEFLREGMARGGVFIGLFPKPKKAEARQRYVRFEEDQSERSIQDVLQISVLKLGNKEEVDKRETQRLEYSLMIDKAEQAKVTLWIELKTSLPLKRHLLLGQGKEQVQMTETYVNYRINEKIDAKEFALPK